MATHVTFAIGEHEASGYHCCDVCKTKTMLVSAPSSWSVNEEPYKSDERVETDEGDYVEISAEVSAHFCPECRTITSFSFNQ